MWMVGCNATVGEVCLRGDGQFTIGSKMKLPRGDVSYTIGRAISLKDSSGT